MRGSSYDVYYVNGNCMEHRQICKMNCYINGKGPVGLGFVLAVFVSIIQLVECGEAYATLRERGR